MQPTTHPQRSFGDFRRAQPHTREPAPKQRHQLITQFDSLIVLTQGMVDLGLYELICSAADRHGPQLKEILIDLAGADPLTLSGCAALLALDKYATNRDLQVYIVAAGTEVRTRAQDLCRRLIWID